MRKVMWIGVVVVATALSVSSLSADCTPLLRPVSLPSVFPSHAAGPIAWNGSILGVAKVDTGLAHSLWFAEYDSDLNQITPDVEVASDTLNGIIALTWNGSEFAEFYQLPSQQLVFQRISAGGQVVGAPIAVATNHTNSQNQAIDVVWDASRKTYDVVHTIPIGFDASLWMTAVQPDGTIAADVPITFFFATTPTPRIAASSGSIGIVWIYDDRSGTGERLFSAVVDPTNHVLGLQQISATGHAPVIAASSTGFLVIYEGPGSGGKPELRSTQLSLAGAVTKSDATFLKPAGVDIATRSLIWNPTLAEWALVYSDTNIGFDFGPGDTRIRRFKIPATLPPSDTFFAPDSLHRDYLANYPLAWTGVSYIGSISRNISPSDGSDTALVRLCPLIASASGPALVATGTVVTFRGTTSGGTPDFKFAWDFGDLDTAVGQVVTHRYPHPGTYTVTLTVTDGTGAISVTTLTIRVVVPRERVARH